MQKNNVPKEKALLGEEIIPAKDHIPIAKLIPLAPAKRAPGTGKGGWMAPDFDETPNRLEFADPDGEFG